ncbi:Sterol desaturase/sphingolipid hydroxylase, fatty acid hydroxylase superfamily [Burkholderia sp. D7]|nr:Sterol desaturase/sphingolipid hydroxylase, fatty acid hydroxylase superfamily [Burkholderia sp. D7]
MRLKPVEAQPLKSVQLNLAYTLVNTLVDAITVPLFSVATVLAVNAAGGGWIVLPAAGWMLLPAFLLYALTLDFSEYLFHRAQHRVPIMWAMHSFHHSDAALNASTSSRHYWAERGIKMMTIYLAAGILFKTNVLILGMYALLSFYNIFLHMNIRIGFGRWSMLMNSPQYHRIHHSALPEHHDCNFSALFPIFDLIFGTYRMPRRAEYPPTGLDSGEHQSGLIEAIFWPVRSLLRRVKAIY